LHLHILLVIFLGLSVCLYVSKVTQKVLGEFL